MKSGTASFVGYGLIWLPVLIGSILVACGVLPPATVTTLVLLGVLGTFSVLAISSVKRDRTNIADDGSYAQHQPTAKTASERLTELQGLLHGHLITQEEFDRKKEEILRSL